MLLNRAIFLPLLLAACGERPDEDKSYDYQEARIAELETKVADLEEQTKKLNAVQDVLAEATVELKRDTATPSTAPGPVFDNSNERLKRLEMDKVNRDYEEAQRRFKEAVAK